HPVLELSVEGVEIAKLAPHQERALMSQEATLDVGSRVGITFERPGPELVVSGESEELGVVDRLASLPANGHGFLSVVLAAVSGPVEASKRGNVLVHERVGVVAGVGPIELPLAVDERVSEELELVLGAVGKVDVVGRPVAL